MRCTACDAQLPEDASRCTFCGAAVDLAVDARDTVEMKAPVDRKAKPAPAATPAEGLVLVSRYELQQLLYRDSLKSQFRAFDRQTDASVLLSVLAIELVPDDAARKSALDKLQSAIGIGGRYLPGILDAGMDDPFIFAVEPWPSGAALREVMELRLARNKRFRPDELLPVIAQVAAALKAIPPPWRHGEVRAEHVWIDPEGLRLTGAFILPSVDPARVAVVAKKDPTLAPLFAPEILRGIPSDAGDRFGIALVVHEALLGSLPSPNPTGSSSELGLLGDVLRDTLRQTSSQRPLSLEQLVQALADHASLPVPAIDPAPFRRPRQRITNHGAVDQNDAITAPNPLLKVDPALLEATPTAIELPAARYPDEEVPTDRRRRDSFKPPQEALESTPVQLQSVQVRVIAGAPMDGTQEISLDELSPVEAARKPQNRTGDPTEGLDPRLVRAALDVKLEDSASHEIEEVSDGAKTRPLMRLPEMEVSEDAPTPMPPIAAPLPRPPSVRPPAPAPAPRRIASVPPPQPVVVPEGVKAIPRPRYSQPDSLIGSAADVLYDDSSAGGMRSPLAQNGALLAPMGFDHLGLASDSQVAPVGVPVPDDSGQQPATLRTHDVDTLRPSRRRRKQSGWIIVTTALVVALVIVAIAWKQHAASVMDENQRFERARQHEERIRQLREQDNGR